MPESTTINSGVLNPLDFRIVLVKYLFIVIEQVTGSLPVYFIFSILRIDCIFPSSPSEPWRAIQAWVTFLVFKTSIKGSMVSTRITSSPLDCKDSNTALPVMSDISLSEELPP